eukprot:56881-Prymnesium_polylepis.1
MCIRDSPDPPLSVVWFACCVAVVLVGLSTTGFKAGFKGAPRTSPKAKRVAQTPGCAAQKPDGRRRTVNGDGGTQPTRRGTANADGSDLRSSDDR